MGGGGARVCVRPPFVRACVPAYLRACVRVCLRACVRDVFAIYNNNI